MCSSKIQCPRTVPFPTKFAPPGALSSIISEQSTVSQDPSPRISLGSRWKWSNFTVIFNGFLHIATIHDWKASTSIGRPHGLHSQHAQHKGTSCRPSILTLPINHLYTTQLTATIISTQHRPLQYTYTYICTPHNPHQQGSHTSTLVADMKSYMQSDQKPPLPGVPPFFIFPSASVPPRGTIVPAYLPCHASRQRLHASPLLSLPT